MCRENKGIWVLFFAVQLVSPLTLTLHCWKPMSWSIHDPDAPKKTWPQGYLPYRWGSQCSDQWVLTHCCWWGPVWATQFLPLFPPSIFALGTLLSQKPILVSAHSISSLHCLLASHSKWIKTQFRNWSILRSSDENAACKDNSLQVSPGSRLPREPWSPS